MRPPLVETEWHRHRSIWLRENAEWQELVPHSNNLRIPRVFSEDLSAGNETASDYHAWNPIG